MIEPETREYLDGEWTVETWPVGFPTSRKIDIIVICGLDGNPILLFDNWSSAHSLTPAAVAEYLMEIHEEHLRLRSKLADIEEAVKILENEVSGKAKISSESRTKDRLADAIEILKREPENRLMIPAEMNKQGES